MHLCVYFSDSIHKATLIQLWSPWEIALIFLSHTSTRRLTGWIPVSRAALITKCSMENEESVTNTRMKTASRNLRIQRPGDSYFDLLFLPERLPEKMSMKNDKQMFLAIYILWLISGILQDLLHNCLVMMTTTSKVTGNLWNIADIKHTDLKVFSSILKWVSDFTLDLSTMQGHMIRDIMFPSSPTKKCFCPAPTHKTP